MAKLKLNTSLKSLPCRCKLPLCEEANYWEVVKGKIFASKRLFSLILIQSEINTNSFSYYIFRPFLGEGFSRLRSCSEFYTAPFLLCPLKVNCLWLIILSYCWSTKHFHRRSAPCPDVKGLMVKISYVYAAQSTPRHGVIQFEMSWFPPTSKPASLKPAQIPQDYLSTTAVTAV